MNVKYDHDTNTVRLTVRELTDSVCRGGDIGGGYGLTAQDGELVHKRIADDAASDVLTEMPLECEFLIDGVKYILSGRADLIHTGDKVDVIEEIKTVSGTFYGGADRIPLSHISQGILYAYMWCRSEFKEAATVRITYEPKNEGRARSFECGFDVSELKSETNKMLLRYSKWAKYRLKREQNLKKELISQLRFPYSDVREGQRDFMTAVVRAARLGRRALIEAPTGTGKTAASLYPSFKALGASYIDRVFYLTQKSSTAESAEKALDIFLRELPSVRTITVLARDRICLYGRNTLYPGSYCSADFCPRAKGHYDRVDDALSELIIKRGSGRHITSAAVAEIAEKYNVCPYELSLDASELCDVIVCDCNYVFDPKVYFRRYFADGDENTHKSEKYLFLCDEAHNLVDRASSMYSASLKLSTAEKLRDLTDGVDPELTEALTALSDGIRGLRSLASETITEASDGSESGYAIKSEPQTALCALAKSAGELCGRLLREIRCEKGVDDTKRRKYRKISQLYAELSDFASSADVFDKHHVTFVEVFGGDIQCRHLCLDPSAHIDKSLSRAHAAVLFSATLQPPDYFMYSLGIGKKGDSLELPSPYDVDNLCIMAADRVSTRLADRENTAGQIVEMISALAEAKTGNYICYLPSYKYLTLISDAFIPVSRSLGFEVTVQKKSMSETEREEFLSRFEPSPTRSHVGFCVLGGLFSEGVDLPGDRLSGAVIVGVGFPQISAELNLRRDHFDAMCERGHEFAYMFPGMNKVLQAAGRVIRGESDRGVVLLIDDRFGLSEYRALFPDHWSKLRYIGDVRSEKRILSDFWNTKNKLF